MAKRVLVCGGREFNDYELLVEELSLILPDVIIHGAARGADSLAGEFAEAMKIPTEVYPADWNKYGKRAGYLRNVQMLEEGKPDLVVAFPGGKGTAMMINLAKKAGVEVTEVKNG
jgi:hypothetical protein